MITIFWDLDGLLCDYDSYWGSDKTFNKEKFKLLVMEHQMFEKLLPLAKGVDLFLGVYDYLKDNNIKYNFEILSSLGSPNDKELAEEVARQKAVWVRRHFADSIGNLNFVEQKGKKKRFATPTSILIDDTNQNIWDFDECHGHGILYNNNMDYKTIKQKVFCTIDLVNNMSRRGIY